MRTITTWAGFAASLGLLAFAGAAAAQPAPQHGPNDPLPGEDQSHYIARMEKLHGGSGRTPPTKDGYGEINSFGNWLAGDGGSLPPPMVLPEQNKSNGEYDPDTNPDGDVVTIHGDSQPPSDPVMNKRQVFTPAKPKGGATTSGAWSDRARAASASTGGW
jgi:hypothetical protein